MLVKLLEKDEEDQERHCLQHSASSLQMATPGAAWLASMLGEKKSKN